MFTLVAANSVLAYAVSEGTTRGVVLVAGLLAVAIGALTAWWLTRHLIEPLQHALHVAKKITGGDLAANIDAHGVDEFGELMEALKRLRELMFQVVSEVRTGTTTVAGTSSQLNRDNAALADRTRNQADSLQATAASMRQITSAVKENADNAGRANTLVLSASDSAVKGGKVVSEVVDTMGSIKQSSRRS